MYDALSRRPALYIGTRMRRLAERIQSESVRLMRDADLPLQSSNVLLVASLYKDGPQTLGGLASILDVAQPTVTRAAQGLIDAGLVEVTRGSTDQRVKMLTLTGKGRDAWIVASVRVFGPLEAAVDEMLQGIDGPLFSSLETLEALLDERSLDVRARAHRGAGLTIREYDERRAQAFREITEEWMSDEKVLTPADVEKLSDPERHILRVGGVILFVEARDIGPVGTGALLKIEDDVFELAHFGVSRSARGGKAGEILGKALIARAQAMGARLIYLISREQLKPALALYEALGFRRSEDAHIRFGGRDARAELTMIYTGAVPD